MQGAFTITDCKYIKKRLRSRDYTRKQFVTQRKLSNRNREVQMKLRRSSSSLITASLIVYQILCNFKANTSTELAVNFAWHSAADVFILSTLLLHPSANITPAAAHLEPILPRGSIYGSYRAIRCGYRSLATDAAFAATGEVPDATTARLHSSQLPQLPQRLLLGRYQTQSLLACLYLSFFRCCSGCY